MNRPHLLLEQSLRRAGVWPVAGIDEAGRGPLAGPVAAAAVILDPANIPDGVDDAKALTAGAREALFDAIIERALGIGIAFASTAEIDRLNIRQATFLAMGRAFAALPLAPAHVLVDGNDLPPSLAHCGEAVIKGDATSLSIAAASILAKVARDRLMRRLCARYPVYGFSRHNGYGTIKHRAALVEHGPCPAHRRSFAPVRVLIQEATGLDP